MEHAAIVDQVQNCIDFTIWLIRGEYDPLDYSGFLLEGSYSDSSVLEAVSGLFPLNSQEVIYGTHLFDPNASQDDIHKRQKLYRGRILGLCVPDRVKQIQNPMMQSWSQIDQRVVLSLSVSRAYSMSLPFCFVIFLSEQNGSAESVSIYQHGSIPVQVCLDKLKEHVSDLIDSEAL